MRKKALSIVLVTSMLSLAACGTPSTNTPPANTEKAESIAPSAAVTEPTAAPVAPTQPPATEAPAAPSNIDFKGETGNLVYVKHEISQDYEGNPALIVYFNYTNNDAEAKMYMTEFNVEAYQNGVQCETAITTSDVTTNASTKLKQGSTIEVASAFKLTDMSNVELEVSDLFSLSEEKSTQVLTLQ